MDLKKSKDIKMQSKGLKTYCRPIAHIRFFILFSEYILTKTAMQKKLGLTPIVIIKIGVRK